MAVAVAEAGEITQLEAIGGRPGGGGQLVADPVTGFQQRARTVVYHGKVRYGKRKRRKSNACLEPCALEKKRYECVGRPREELDAGETDGLSDKFGPTRLARAAAGVSGEGGALVWRLCRSVLGVLNKVSIKVGSGRKGSEWMEMMKESGSGSERR